MLLLHFIPRDRKSAKIFFAITLGLLGFLLWVMWDTTHTIRGLRDHSLSQSSLTGTFTGYDKVVVSKSFPHDSEYYGIVQVNVTKVSPAAGETDAPEVGALADLVVKLSKEEEAELSARLAALPAKTKLDVTYASDPDSIEVGISEVANFVPHARQGIYSIVTHKDAQPIVAQEETIARLKQQCREWFLSMVMLQGLVMFTYWRWLKKHA